MLGCLILRCPGPAGDLRVEVGLRLRRDVARLGEGFRIRLQVGVQAAGAFLEFIEGGIIEHGPPVPPRRGVAGLAVLHEAIALPVIGQQVVLVAIPGGEIHAPAKAAGQNGAAGK